MPQISLPVRQHRGMPSWKVLKNPLRTICFSSRRREWESHEQQGWPYGPPLYTPNLDFGLSKLCDDNHMREMSDSCWSRAQRDLSSLSISERKSPYAMAPG